MRRFKILNLILIITILFLSGEIITNNSSDNFITGQSIYTGDQIQPICSYYNGLEVKQLPSENCCYEATIKLKCELFNYENYDIKCYTSEKSHTLLLLDQETFNFCQNEGYDIEIE